MTECIQRYAMLCSEDVRFQSEDNVGICHRITEAFTVDEAAALSAIVSTGAFLKSGEETVWELACQVVAVSIMI